jgi:hypothetical protein
VSYEKMKARCEEHFAKMHQEERFLILAANRIGKAMIAGEPIPVPLAEQGTAISRLASMYRTNAWMMDEAMELLREKFPAAHDLLMFQREQMLHHLRAHQASMQ